MTLGEIIKKYRVEHEMSMDKFSEMSGISKSYISLLEKNWNPTTGRSIAPSIKCIRQVADCVHIDFNTLFSMLDGNISLAAEPASTDFSVSPLEKDLITAFRKADDLDRQMVLRILKIKQKGDVEKLA